MDFDILYLCFKENRDDPVLKEFLHNWLPKKVSYLANEVANGRLRNSDFEEIKGKLIELIFEKIDRIEPGQSFRSWICKAIKFLTKNYIRKKKAELIDISEEDNKISTQLEKGKIESPFSDEQIDKLYSGIESLPPKQYQSFYLKYVRGLSSQEVADKLGWTVQQVDQSNFRARRNLKKMLGEHFPDYVKVRP